MKKLDEAKTALTARLFLSKELPTYIRMADRNIESLSSPQLSLASAHTNAGNAQEKKIDDYFGSIAVVDAAHAAIQHIPSADDLKSIFILSFLKNYSRDEVAIKLSISPSTVSRRRKESLIEFAYRMEVQKMSKSHNCDWLPTLLVYQP